MKPASLLVTFPLTAQPLATAACHRDNWRADSLTSPWHVSNGVFSITLNDAPRVHGSVIDTIILVADHLATSIPIILFDQICLLPMMTAEMLSIMGIHRFISLH